MKNCRRWRRRSANLTGEFKAKKGWLESHLWHAKRCKMIDYWGFRVSAHLNEKCLKSTFRSSKSGTLLHDFSYWQPYWIESFDKDKFCSVYGCEDILDIIIEHDGIQICPLKIFTNTFTRSVMFIHPAAVQTKIFDNEGFQFFLGSFSINLNPAFNDLCTFKLHGPKSELVLNELFGISLIESFPLRIQFSDPRTTSKQVVFTKDYFNDSFLDSRVIKTDNYINSQKSTLLISNTETECSEMVTVAVTKKNSEYFLSCPKKWARIVWNKMTRIKPVKVAGIDQVDQISFENTEPVYPRDFVGSPAYEILSNQEKARLEDIYNRKPPAKRISYKKFTIKSPFKSCFLGLGLLRKVFIEVDGKGVILNLAEIYDNNKILIGHVTTATRSSLKNGCSTAIGSISISHDLTEQTVLIRNLSSSDNFRVAKINSIL